MADADVEKVAAALREKFPDEVHAWSAEALARVAIEALRPEGLTAAMEHRDALKQQVIDWMNSEAKKLRLRANGEAPMWAAYQAAEDDVERLSAKS